MPFLLCCLSWVTLLFAAGPDTAVLLKENNAISVLPWQYQGPPQTVLQVSAEAALHGKKGVAVRPGRGEYTWTCRLPFFKEAWQRFYLRLNGLDTLLLSRPDLGAAPKPASLFFLSCEVAEKTGRDHILFCGMLLKYNTHSKQVELWFRYPEGGHEKERVIEERFNPRQAYCVEVYSHLFKPESVAVEVLLDGKPKLSMHYRYFLLPKFFSLEISNSHGKDVGWQLDLDDFGYGDTRLFPFPVTPVRCSTQVDSCYAVMFASDIEPFAEEEAIQASRYQIYSSVDSLFPVFDWIEQDPVRFNSKRVSFNLEQGDYYWRVTIRNNFGLWSDWSKQIPFRIDKVSEKRFGIKKGYFTNPNSDQPVSTLNPETWYDFHVMLDSRGFKESNGYWLVWLSDTTYTFGSPENKGGIFSSASSYACNVSWVKQKATLFEKQTENSTVSSEIPDNQRGLYCDILSSPLWMDSTGQHMRIRVKLLKNVQSGLWRFNTGISHIVGKDAYSDDVEEFSNIYRGLINVTPQHSDGKRRLLIILGIVVVLLLVGGFVFIRKRRDEKETSPVADSVDLERIRTYIEQNVSNPLSVETIREALKLSHRRLYQIMRKKGVTLQQFTNQIRIDQAKKLLAENKEMTVSAIGFAVGFSELNTFFRVFKTLENLTPLEYREQIKPGKTAK